MESVKGREYRLEFVHLKRRLDYTNSSQEISAIVEEAYKIAVQAAKKGEHGIAETGFREVSKKARDRAIYLGLKPYAERLAKAALDAIPLIVSVGTGSPKPVIAQGTSSVKEIADKTQKALPEKIIEMKKVGDAYIA